jgi:putative phage-type endonuclease
MQRESTPVTDEQAWLKARAHDVTSTEVAALFDASPYTTAYELWHRKKAGEVATKTDNERMKWGRRLESAIALGVAEDQGWKASPRKVYERLPELRLGASFDFQAERDGHLGLIEVKNVDKHIFLDQWHGEGESLIAPTHIELQLQAQLLVSGLTWGCIVVLAGGNSAHILHREADRLVHGAITKRVAAFWSSIEADRPPLPDFERDADEVRRLLMNVDDGKVLDADEKLEAKIATLLHAQEQAAHWESQVEAGKAAILYDAGTASKIRSKTATISCGVVAGSAGKIITPEMVGQTINARSGYRAFRLTKKKQ